MQAKVCRQVRSFKIARLSAAFPNIKQEEVLSLLKTGMCVNASALQVAQAHRALSELKQVFVFIYWTKVIACASFKMVKFLK